MAMEGYIERKSRIPHGMRGLKFDKEHAKKELGESHPAWDAWIEIAVCPR